MGKIAIVTDSNSSITLKEAEELGVFIVPMPVVINGIDYLEGIDLSLEGFFEKQRAGEDISSSQPAPGSLITLWEEVLENYDEIVYIPMASTLSSSYATAKMTAEEFEGKVHVVDNLRISATQRQSVLDALHLVEQGKTAQEIVEYLEADARESVIYLAADTLKYLQKGGRISSMTALAGTVLNVKPVLMFRDGVLDAYGKARGMKKAIKLMAESVKNDLQTRFAGKKMRIQMAYAGDVETAKEWWEEMKKHFPDEELTIVPLTMSICCHIGEKSIGLACFHAID